MTIAHAAQGLAEATVYGVKGVLLPDGTRLIRSVPLGLEHEAEFAADQARLARARVHRAQARGLNLLGRIAVVAMGLALGYLVFAQRIDLVVAGVIALFLLAAPEMLARVSGRLERRRVLALESIAFTRELVERGVPGIGALPSSERHELYPELLAGRAVDVAGRRISLVRTAEGSLELRVTTAPAAAA
jgi:hypothetical protein